MDTHLVFLKIETERLLLEHAATLEKQQALLQAADERFTKTIDTLTKGIQHTTENIATLQVLREALKKASPILMYPYTQLSKHEGEKGEVDVY